MPHIEALAYSLDSEDPNVHGKVCIDVPGHFLEIELFLSPVQDIPIVEFKAAGDAVAESVHFFIGPSCAGPFYSLQIVHIGFEDESLLAENTVQDVLNSIVSVSLVL